MITAPGLKLFKTYQKKWFSRDLLAGLSVAAIAMPVGIAYAGIIGLPLQTGLYSCIFPMIAYAIFGSSKQLIVGPDSATCILVAAAITPLAAVGSAEYATLSVLLALVTGVLCIAFGIFRLDFIANFLSKPILNGYLNGLAISIIVGQFSKVFGYSIKSQGLFRMLYEFFSKIEQTHIITFAIGFSGFIFLRFLKRFIPKVPAPLILVIISILIVSLLGLDKHGVVVVGSIPAGLPSFGIPSLDFDELIKLFTEATGIVLISYCSMVLTSKSFASKNSYEIDANQDLYALGISNISSGLFQGFVISGADSRTAVADTSGGKTQMTSVIAAGTIILVLMFLTSSLTYLPMAALGAIVISASIGLFNIEYLKKLYHVSRQEFILAVITSVCVLTVGVLPAVIFAVTLALIRLLARASSPKDAVLGRIEDSGNYFDILEFPEARTIPGILIYRFDANILFFNADKFRSRIRYLVENSGDKIKHVLIDAESMVIIDITGADTFSELIAELKKKNISVSICRAKSEFLEMIKKSGIISNVKLYSSVKSGVRDLTESV